MAVENGTPDVALLGAGGTMGLGMARNLAAAGIAVRAWNRTPERLEPLASESGVEACESPGEAARGADVLLTMLSDAQATLETAGSSGALEALGEGGLWLQMGTIGPPGTEECLELAGREGVELVDAPVLGTKKPAEEGELIVLASGPQASRPAAQPCFDAVGKRTIWLGGEAGAASRLKVAINSWIVTVVEGTAEAVALAQGLGVEPEALLDALSGGPLELPYMKMKSEAMLSRDFTPSFRLALAAKDAGLAVDAAADAGLDLPMLAAIRERLEQGAAEHGDEDVAATYLLSAPAGAAAGGSTGS
jgi:3-hydroxyisobutyrate dehydrogenase